MPQVGASHEVKAVDEPESGCWRGVVCYPSDLMRHGHNNLKLGMRPRHYNPKELKPWNKGSHPTRRRVLQEGA